MLSTLHRKDSIIVNDVERFYPEDFVIIPENEIKIIKTPDLVPNDYLMDQLIRFQIKSSGLYQLSPFSFNWNQFDNIYTLMAMFKRYTADVSLSSCRVDAIARDKGLVDLIAYFRARNITIAVEGISQRIRNFLQKSLLEEELYAGFNNVIESGFSSIKVYYIYCGDETPQDLDEFEKFLLKLNELRKFKNKQNLQIRFSFTPLLSTLNTPTQYHSNAIARSVKADSGIIYQIKQISSSSGFDIRLSSTLPASEFQQSMEFTDRRSVPLIIYLGLNGANIIPRFSVSFFSDEIEISKVEFDKLPTGKRLIIPKGMYYKGKVLNTDTYFKVDFFDKASSGKIYTFINEHQLFSEYTVFDLYNDVKEAKGNPLPDKIIDTFPYSRAERLKGKFTTYSESDPEDLAFTYPNGKDVFSLKGNTAVSSSGIEIMKRYLPIMTNGVTYHDIIAQKDALFIFPSSHIQLHKNKHVGSNFRQYFKNRFCLFDSYCYKMNLGQCLPLNMKVKVRIRNLKGGEKAPEYQDLTKC